MTDGQAPREAHTVSGSGLKAKLKELIHEGNVRRVVIKNKEGRTLLDLPLSAGLLGAAMIPFWAAVGGIAMLAAQFTIEVERIE